MMKNFRNLFALISLLLITSVLRSQNVMVLSFSVDCTSNTIEMYYDEDDPTYNHSMWLESFNGIGWDSIPGSYLFTPGGGIQYYSYTSPTPIITNMYRMNYRNDLSFYQFVVDTLNLDCGHYMGIDQNTGIMEITDVVIYNLSGQITELTIPGLYIKQYNQGGQPKRKKFYYSGK